MKIYFFYIFKDSNNTAGIKPGKSTQHFVTVHGRNNIFHKPQPLCILNLELVEADTNSHDAIQLPTYMPNIDVRTEVDGSVSHKIHPRNVETEIHKNRDIKTFISKKLITL
jgi:hypothetical protein